MLVLQQLQLFVEPLLRALGWKMKIQSLVQMLSSEAEAARTTNYTKS
jgi:hypothetical protein